MMGVWQWNGVLKAHSSSYNRFYYFFPQEFVCARLCAHACVFVPVCVVVVVICVGMRMFVYAPAWESPYCNFVVRVRGRNWGSHLQLLPRTRTHTHIHSHTRMEDPVGKLSLPCTAKHRATVVLSPMGSTTHTPFWLTFHTGVSQRGTHTHTQSCPHGLSRTTDVTSCRKHVKSMPAYSSPGQVLRSW